MSQEIYNKLDKMDSKLTDVHVDIAGIKTELAVYNAQLKVHMKRTDAVEKQVNILSEFLWQAKGAGALIGLLALIATIASILVLFK